MEAEGGVDVVHVELEAGIVDELLAAEVMGGLAVEAVPAEEFGLVVEVVVGCEEGAAVAGGEVFDGSEAIGSKGVMALVAAGGDGLGAVFDEEGAEVVFGLVVVEDVVDFGEVDGIAGPVNGHDGEGVGGDFPVDVLGVDIAGEGVDIGPDGGKAVMEDGDIGGGAGEGCGDNLVAVLVGVFADEVEGEVDSGGGGVGGIDQG